ncbi:hypothetical protein [Niallia nealsonii]|uniref:Uncharacterized protein n=1 Tax=Niallia nealsonii TaxID=115979 RepID=A0A2N0Z428_9BACI|nr:hypothetical protein [Niallia nealsonii]PKG24268.1 hypothetical protein CWS01_07715 [Niallia nealsonii]
MDIKYKIFGPKLLDRLETSFDNQFERYVQLILLTGLGGYKEVCPVFTLKSYKDTRAEKDKGLDGFIRHGENKYECFSITGPKHTSKWESKFNKIKKDYQAAKKYCEDRKYKMVKWNMVINFYTIEEQERAIIELAEKDGVDVEVYNPRRLFQLLRTEEDYYKVAQGMGEAFPIGASIEQLAHHEFAFVALKSFILYENNGSFDEKLKLLHDIRKYIYYRTFFNLTEDEVESGKGARRPALLIGKNTKIHTKYQETYQYMKDNQGQGIIYPTGLKPKDAIRKNDEGYLIPIKNLSGIHSVIIYLEKLLLEKGNYKIEKAFEAIIKDRDKVIKQRKSV